jgi:hypothetical protein
MFVGLNEKLYTIDINTKDILNVYHNDNGIITKICSYNSDIILFLSE